MREYVIYARKSTESEDRQVLSIGAQIAELKAVAARRDIRVARVVEESRSAKEPGRPLFTSLLDDIDHGRLAGILCWKLDRLARNPVEGGRVIWSLTTRHLDEIITPSRTFTAASDDAFMMHIEFGMARKFIDDLSDNVKRGLRARVEHGGAVCKPPAGYTVDRNTGTYVPDPVRGHLIRRAFQLVLEGARPSEALVMLNGWGYRMPARGDCEGAPMSRSSFYEALSNPFYTGLIRFKGDVYPGKHEPLLAPEAFRKLQTILRRADRPRRSRHDWTYAGLIRCGGCGGNVVGGWHRGRRGKLYAYYSCPRRNGCGQPYAPAGQIDDQVVDWLGRWSLPAPVVDWYLETINAIREENDQAARAVQKARTRTRRSIERQLQTLVDLRVRNAVRDEEYLPRRERLLAELAALGRPNDAVDMFEPARATIRALNEARNRFLAGGTAERRAIVLAACSNLRLLDRKVLIEAQKPFVPLAEDAVNLFRKAQADEVRTRVLHALAASPSNRSATVPSGCLTDCASRTWSRTG